MTSFFEISDGLDVTQSADATKRLNVSVSAGATAGTTLNLVAAQTASRTLDLNDLTSTVATRKNINDVWFLSDEKAEGTDGGTFALGAWRTRDLQTLRKATSTGTEVALNNAGAGPGIVLATGTYLVQFFATANGVEQSQARFQNVTDASTELTGMSCKIQKIPIEKALVMGLVAVSGGPKTYELQHQGSATEVDEGFGVAGGFATEVYTAGSIRRLAT